MSERPVAKVGEQFLRFIEPIVYRQVVFDLAAPLSYTAQSVMVRMAHI
jgi:hypothetical protein